MSERVSERVPNKTNVHSIHLRRNALFYIKTHFTDFSSCADFASILSPFLLSPRLRGGREASEREKLLIRIFIHHDSSFLRFVSFLGKCKNEINLYGCIFYHL